MITLALPGHGPHGMQPDGFSVLPFLGGFLLLALVLLALTGLFLWRRGSLSLPGLRGPRPPEDGARNILAERFARGDINADEFMERASILNWTPGTNPLPPKSRRAPR